MRGISYHSTTFPLTSAVGTGRGMWWNRTVELLHPDAWQPLVLAHLEESAKPVIVVLGPTASGKTNFSLELCRILGEKVEVINADSRQLYTGLDIGTAKITDEERGEIPHHLFSVLDPKEQVTIAWYQEHATNLIHQIHTRGQVPVLVGGSMLYISSVIDGLRPLPEADPELRKELEALYDTDDGWALFDELSRADPETAKSFDKANKQYVVRAVELLRLTGFPPSTLKKTVPPDFQTLMLGLEWPRDELTKRIDERTKKLLSSGWIEEVESLLDKGYTSMDPGFKSSGYREIAQWLQSDEQNKDELTEIIAAKTRQYAKRQMTWWKDDDRIKWIDARQL